MLQSTYTIFFLFFFLPGRCIVFLFSSFLSVLSAPVRSSYSCLCVLVFFFLLLSLPAFFLVPFVDVVLWYLRLPFTVTRFVLNPWRTLLAQAPNRTMLYTHLPYHNDSIIVKTDAHRKTHEERKQEDFFTNIFPSLYCKGSKGLLKDCPWEGAGDRT